MRTIIASLLLILAAPITASAEVVDLALYLPGRLAATHQLEAKDGRRYSFTRTPDTALATGEGLIWWQRSLDPGCIDYQVWSDHALYYLGWTCQGVTQWILPRPMSPRWWDPAIPWTSTAVEDSLVETARGVVHRTTTIIMSLERVIVAGEELFYGTASGLAGENMEEWWVSACIPIVPEGGCAPGVRAYRISHDGAVLAEGMFVRWVAKD